MSQHLGWGGRAIKLRALMVTQEPYVGYGIISQLRHRRILAESAEKGEKPHSSLEA